MPHAGPASRRTLDRWPSGLPPLRLDAAGEGMLPRRRILHVIHAAEPEAVGGSQTYLRQIVRAQRDAGLAPAILTGSMVRWPTVGVEQLELDGVRAWRLHRDDTWFDLRQGLPSRRTGQSSCG